MERIHPHEPTGDPHEPAGHPHEPTGDPGSGDPGGRLAAFYEVWRAAWLEEVPALPPVTFQRFATILRHGVSGEPGEVWITREPEGEIAGGYAMHLPGTDNTHLAVLANLLAVHPSRQRRGIGRSLLEHAIERARVNDRNVVYLRTHHSPGRSGGGAALARSAGFEPVRTDAWRLLDLVTAPWDVYEEMRSEASAMSADYELERWSGLTPPGRLEDVALLFNGMNDAPTDDLEYHDEQWDAARVRRQDETAIAGGQRPYTVIARHMSSGEPAGLTQVFANAGYALQADTVVLGKHRGHRLGLLLKLTMARWLRERGIEVISTWNATSNEHMIAVNEALGFRLAGHATGWQLKLGR